MITIVLPADASSLCFGATVEAMREIDIGGRLMRDMKSRLRTTLLKAESVRPGWVLLVLMSSGLGMEDYGESLYVRARNRYSLTRSLR